MIYCRDLNIIFIKTNKVGGTSFEIALSKYCNENDIVTPILDPKDESTRSNLGYQGPTNYENQKRTKELINLGVTGKFRNNMTAEEIHQNLGHKIFTKCKKISIHREPLDFIVSLFWYRKTKNNKEFKFTALSLRQWLEKKAHLVERNYKIAPISGPNSIDIILDYATLADDIKKVSELPSDFLKTFVSLKAKSNYRPKSARDPIRFLQENNCGDYIPKIIRLSNKARSCPSETEL